MKATELLRSQIESSKMMTASLLADMQDAPLAMPTPQGGNPPLWIAGHLVYSEARLTNELLFDKPGPLLDWGDTFGRGTQPSSDASHYPLTILEILAKWDEIRVNTLAILAKLTDDDLDKPAARCPPGREAVFGTFGKAFTMVAMHPMHHRGQVADARRALGRKPLTA
jgi:DinB superfamily